MKIPFYIYITVVLFACDDNKQSSHKEGSEIEKELIVIDTVFNSIDSIARKDVIGELKVKHNEVSTMCYVNDTLKWIGFKFDYPNIFPLKGHVIYIDSGYIVIPYENGIIWYEGEFVNCCNRPNRFLGKGIHIVRYYDGTIKAKVDYSEKTIIEYLKTGGIKKYNFEEYIKIEPHMVQWIEID